MDGNDPAGDVVVEPDTPRACWIALDELRIRLQNLRDPSLTGGIDYATRQLSLAITKVEEAQHWLGVTSAPAPSIPEPADVGFGAEIRIPGAVYAALSEDQRQAMTRDLTPVVMQLHELLARHGVEV